MTGILQRDLYLAFQIQQTLAWNKIGAGGDFDMAPERKELQHKCLLEELEELRAAIEAQDKVEVVDALCDILFVALYATWMALPEDAMTENEFCGFVDDHALQIRLDQSASIEQLHSILSMLCQQFRYFDMCTLLIGYSRLLSFDLKKAYHEVVLSNFSKFPQVDEIDLKATLDWFKTSSKYSDVVPYEISGHYVFRCDNGNGKIVKPNTFFEPKLSQFIY